MLGWIGRFELPLLVVLLDEAFPQCRCALPNASAKKGELPCSNAEACCVAAGLWGHCLHFYLRKLPCWLDFCRKNALFTQVTLVI